LSWWRARNSGRFALAQHHQVGVAGLQHQAGFGVVVAHADFVADAGALGMRREFGQRFAAVVVYRLRVLRRQHAAVSDGVAVAIEIQPGQRSADQVGFLAGGQQAGQLVAGGRVGGMIGMHQDGFVRHDELLVISA